MTGWLRRRPAPASSPVSDSAAESSKRVLSESLAYTAIDAAQNLLALLVVPASLFWLSPADMGVVTLALVGTQIAMTVVTLGLDFGVIRFFLVWAEDDRQARAIGALWLVIGAAVAVTIAALLIARVWLPADTGVIVAAVTAGAALGVRAIPLAVFRVTSRLGIYAWVVVIGSAMQAVLQIALLAGGFRVTGFLAAAAIASWIGAGWATLLLLGRGSWVGRWPDRATATLAGWSMGGALANRAASSVDRLALSWWSTVDALGVYGAASRWALPLRMVSGGTKLAIAPALSRAERSAEAHDASRSIAVFITLLALLSVALLGSSSLLVWTPWRSVTADFQRLLTLLLGAQLIGCLTLIAQVLLYYVGSSGQSTTLALVSAVSGIIALLWLVPHYGTTGAATAQLLSSLLTLLAFAWLAGDRHWAAMRADGPLLVLAAVLLVPWLGGPLATTAASLAGAALLSRGAWREWRHVRGERLTPMDGRLQ